MVYHFDIILLRSASASSYLGLVLLKHRPQGQQGLRYLKADRDYYMPGLLAARAQFFAFAKTFS